MKKIIKAGISVMMDIEQAAIWTLTLVSCRSNVVVAHVV